MHFSPLIACTALLIGLAAANPLAAEATHSGHPDHLNNTHYRGLPRPINKAPYGGAHTFFKGLEEAQLLNKTLQARATAGVYWCSEEWHGSCHWQLVSGGACHSWTAGLYLSFGPDEGIRC